MKEQIKRRGRKLALIPSYPRFWNNPKHWVSSIAVSVSLVDKCTEASNVNGSFSWLPTSAQGSYQAAEFLICPINATSCDAIDYNTTNHGEAPELSLRTLRPILIQAATKFIIEESSSNCPYDLTQTSNNLSLPSQDERTQGSKPGFSKRLSSTQPHDAGLDIQLSTSSEHFIETKNPTLNYSKVTHETATGKEQDILMSTDVSTTETWGVWGGYANTDHACRCARFQPSTFTTVTSNATSPPIQHILGLETVECTRTIPSFKGPQVHAGSYEALGTETHIPSPTMTEHAVESNQMAAWRTQTSAKTVTLAERLEMNKNAWVGC